MSSVPIVWATIAPLACSAAAGLPPNAHIYPYQQADDARQLARDQCKPLALHFVPNDDLGAAQVRAFYEGRDRITDEMLERVVIVALPYAKFAKSAAKYGITSRGGYRTISAYDLGAFERESMNTVRSGFR